jgi:membrane-bound inhibitor of C-type lysozyme
MKSIRFISGLLISLLTFSCQKTGKTYEETTSQTAVTEPKVDEIVRDTVINKDGVQLAIAFNNTNQTAAFVLNGEHIDLKQEQMGSGIKYSNANYEFTEHQGVGILKKSGKVVFAFKK